MDLNQAKNLLTKAGLEIKSEKRLGNNTGSQLKLSKGAIVNIYDKGHKNRDSAYF